MPNPTKRIYSLTAATIKVAARQNEMEAQLIKIGCESSEAAAAAQYALASPRRCDIADNLKCI